MWKRLKSYILENKKLSILFIGFFTTIVVGGIVFSVLYQPKYYEYTWKAMSGDINSGNYTIAYVSSRVDLLEPKNIKEGENYKTTIERHVIEMKQSELWTFNKVDGGFTISFTKEGYPATYYLNSTSSDKGLYTSTNAYVWNLKPLKDGHYVLDDKRGYYLMFEKKTDYWKLSDTCSETDSGYDPTTNIFSLYRMVNIDK